MTRAATAEHPTASTSSLPTSSGRTAVLVLVVAALVVMLALPIRSWFVQRSQVAAVREDLATTQARLAELQSEKEQWQDLRHVEAQARLRLNYVYPGEVGVVTLGPQESTPEPPQNWYEGLWESVSGAAGRGSSTTTGDPLVIREEAPR